MFKFFKRKKSSETTEPVVDITDSSTHSESDSEDTLVVPVTSSDSTHEQDVILRSQNSSESPSVASANTQDSTILSEASTRPTNKPLAPNISDTPTKPIEKPSWFNRLKQGLSKTGKNISTLFIGVKVDEQLFEELETALIMADASVDATDQLLTKLKQKVKQERIEDSLAVKEALIQILTEHLQVLEKPFDTTTHKPLVMMMTGVNGAGKTTSIGKLAKLFQNQNKQVLLAAGDTFRAAAREQLIEWGKRNQIHVIAQEGGDPAAVAFDAIHAGQARDMDIVMVDTAGRLPTQLHLMEELKKIQRVANKADQSAPHEILLVIDGNTGQNALAQIKAFDEALSLTGLVVTKLDGTAKGGILAAVAAKSQGIRAIPVYWIGVGEGIDDLQPFNASEFAKALLD